MPTSRRKKRASAAAAQQKEFTDLRDVLLCGTPNDFVEFWKKHPEKVSVDAVEAMIRAETNGGTANEVHRLMTWPHGVPDWLEKFSRMLEDSQSTLDEKGVKLPLDRRVSVEVAQWFIAKKLSKLPSELREKIRRTEGKFDLHAKKKRIELHEFPTRELVAFICNLAKLTESSGVTGLGSGASILEALIQHSLADPAIHVRATDSFAETIPVVKNMVVERKSVAEVAEEHAHAAEKQRQLFVCSWPRPDMADELREILSQAKTSGSHAMIIGPNSGGCLKEEFFKALGDDAHVITLYHRAISNDEYFAPHQDKFNGQVRTSVIRIVCYPGSPLYGKSVEEAAALLECPDGFLLPEPTDFQKEMKCENEMMTAGVLPNIDIDNVIALLERDDPKRDNPMVFACLLDRFSEVVYSNFGSKRLTFDPDRVLSAKAFFKYYKNLLDQIKKRGFENWDDSERYFKASFEFASYAPQSFPFVIEHQKSLVSDLCEALQCIMPDSQDEEAELSYSDAVRELHYVTNDAESIAQLRTLFEMHEIDFSIEDVEGDKKMFRIPATRQAYALYMLKTRIFDELIEKLSSYPTQLGCADQVDLESNKEAYALRYLSSDPDFIVKASELLDQHGIGSVRGVDQKTGQDILEIRLFGEIHKFYKLLASLDVDSSAEAAVRPAEIQALVAGGMLAAPAAAAAPAGEAAAPAPAAPGPA